MKSFPIFLLITIVLSNATTGAVSHEPNCCVSGRSSTRHFASLAKSVSFGKAHADPIPFVASQLRGTLREYQCVDGTTSTLYEVKPQSKSETPKYLFVFQEWWGLNGYIKQMADSLALSMPDVTVFALDLYDGKVGTTREEAGVLMNGASEARIKMILLGAMNLTETNAKIATIGWCYGGGWALQTAIELGEKSAGCVMYYGQPEMSTTLLRKLNCPVLGIFAKQDKWITPKVVADFEAKAKQLGKSVRTISYDDDHAFANPSNPKYSKEHAEDAMKQVLEFLRKCFKSER